MIKPKNKGGRPRKVISKNLGGRPTALNEATLEQLKMAFSIGCTNREAVSYADIALSTLQLHIKNNPTFSEQVTAWKQKPILKARQVVVKAINKGDKALAWDYLQKKNRDEFSARIETTGRNGSPVATTTMTTEQARKQADELDNELDAI